MAGDGYSRELCRVVCGQLAELAGYEAVQESAVEVLGELLAKYITELAASSHGYAELAQRTQLNVNDVLLALDDLGTSVPELQTYLASLTPEDNTFAHPLTQYPIQKPGRALPSFLDKREAPPPHIPPFLPAFPDKHTYVQTPKFPGHEEDPAKQTQAVQQGRRQAEKALVKLHVDLTHPTATQPAAGTAAAAAAGAAGPSGQRAGGEEAADEQGAAQPPLGGPAGAAPGVINRFLAPPALAVAPPGGGPGHGAAWGGAWPGAQHHPAFSPGAALHAFGAVLSGAGGGGDGAGPAPADVQVALEEESVMWKYEENAMVAGELREPLGSSLDFASHAHAAALAAAPGRAGRDAFEAARLAAEAAEAAKAAGAPGRRVKLTQKAEEAAKEGEGAALQPRHPAEDILQQSAAEPDKAMEGHDY